MNKLFPIILLLIFCLACGKKQRTVTPIVNLQEQIEQESTKLKKDTPTVAPKDTIIVLPKDTLSNKRK
jgi:hypothetical protein